MGKYIIKKAIFVRGKAYKVGSDIELNEREAQELLARGVISDEVDVAVTEDITVAIEDMKKNDLVEYATKLGIDVPGKATKDEIIELINTLDDEEDEG